MKIEEAITYCEAHECEECPICTKNLDTHSKEDKAIGQVMCCENLIRYELSDKIFTK